MHGGDTPPLRRHTSLPWLLALCLISLGALFQSTGKALQGRSNGFHSEITDSRSSGINATGQMQPDGKRYRTRGQAVPAGANSGVYLLPGDDFAAIERRLADRVTYDPRALDVMYYATLVCNRPVNPQWRTTAKTAKAGVFLAWKDMFCRGRITSGEAAGYQSIMLKERLRSRSEWEKDDGSTTSTLLHFEHEVYSDFPPIMAAGLLDIPDYLNWPVGVEDVQGTPYAAKLPRYQQVALQGIQCSQVGGCGPNDLLTMWLCLTTPHAACSSAASTDDMWAEEFSPDEIAIIARIQQRILDEHARRVKTKNDGP
jgi:hypothetical protein